MALILILYAALLAALGYAVRRAGAEEAHKILYTSLAAAGLAMAAALAALIGLTRKRTYAILASAGASVILTYFTIRCWVTLGDEVPMTARLMTTGMLLLSILTTIYLTHGERSDDFYYGSDGRPRTPAR